MSTRMCAEITVLVSVSTACTEEKVVSINTVTLLLLCVTRRASAHDTFSMPWLFASILIASSTIFIRLSTPRSSLALRTHSFNYR